VNSSACSACGESNCASQVAACTHDPTCNAIFQSLGHCICTAQMANDMMAEMACITAADGNPTVKAILDCGMAHCTQLCL
jgi:hypothetical protein